jgi:hypothetical protein
MASQEERAEETEEKKCTKCGIQKTLCEFGVSRGGHSARCKACARAHGVIYKARLRQERQEDLPKAPKDHLVCKGCQQHFLLTDFTSKRWKWHCSACVKFRYANEYIRLQKNNTDYKERMKAHRETPEVKTRKRRVKREWKRANPEKVREQAKRYQQNLSATKQIQYRLRSAFTTRLKCALGRKTKTIVEYLGMSMESLLPWLEFAWDDEMSWENYGVTWEIDHVLPLSRFDVTSDADTSFVNHWTNLAPLKRRDNQVKNCRIVPAYVHLQEIRLRKYLSLNPELNDEVQSSISLLRHYQHKFSSLSAK